MLTPRYLDGIADDIENIYSQLEQDILQDMARRVSRLGKITAATEWQAQMLAELGAFNKKVKKLLKKYSKNIQEAAYSAYVDAVKKATETDNRIYSEALGREVSENVEQRIRALIEKQLGNLERLTKTTAKTSERLFIKEANRVYMQTQSGAFSYTQAIKTAVDDMAAQGVTSVQYENGKPVRRSIESAVRMNVITGINQTAATISLDNAREVGSDLVEVSAHTGARPEHAAWQGKIYSLSGTSDKYPPFSICGYGTATGICGINCRHSFSPYFEDYGRKYSSKELKDYAGETVTYNGRKMTEYEAEQTLRATERTIRKYKRRAITQEAAGLDDTAARTYLGKWQARARDIVKQTGIKRDYARERVGTPDEQPRAIRPKKK